VYKDTPGQCKSCKENYELSDNKCTQKAVVPVLPPQQPKKEKNGAAGGVIAGGVIGGLAGLGGGIFTSYMVSSNKKKFNPEDTVTKGGISALNKTDEGGKGANNADSGGKDNDDDDKKVDDADRKKKIHSKMISKKF